MPQTHKALVFDCDGVLVNSEEIVQDIELQLLAEHGLTYDRNDFSDRFLGVSNEHFYAELNADSTARLGIPLPNTFADLLTSRARTAFTTRLRAFVGVHDVIKSWSHHLAVASSSSISGLAFKLDITGLAEAFSPHIYSAEHVGRGKPDPAIYLHTARQLQTEPNHCIAVEDSINGVVSAKAAGMHTIGFTAGKHCRPGHDRLLSDAGADAVVQDMEQLKLHIHSL